MDDPFDARAFLVRQRITPVANVYAVLAGPNGEGGQVAYVRQKRLKLREEIVFYRDQAQREPLFRVKARRVLDLGARYDVLGPDGTRIGVFGKAFAASLARSTWIVYSPDESTQVLQVAERNPTVAVVRRVWEFVPWIGDLPFFVRFHFDAKAGDRVVAGYDKITRFRDHYRLSLYEPPPVDVRVLLGLAVALDALQSR